MLLLDEIHLENRNFEHFFFKTVVTVEFFVEYVQNLFVIDKNSVQNQLRTFWHHWSYCNKSYVTSTLQKTDMRLDIIFRPDYWEFYNIDT